MTVVCRRRSARRVFHLAFAWAALVLAPDTFAADPGVSPTEIVLGQTIGLQDGKNDYAVAAQKGIRLYLDQVNAEGGVHGRRIVLRTLDDTGKSDLAAANARKLVEGGVFALFGSLEGGPSTEVVKVAAERRVPLFGPMAGSPSLRRPHQSMVFPVRAEHRDEFRALMVWGRSIGLNTVGFFHADSDNGREHLGNVQRIADELGMKVVLPIPFKSDLSDVQMDGIVQQLARSRPDLVLNHGSAGLYRRLVDKARQAGLKTTFMAVNSGSTEIAASLGASAQGMVFAQVVPSPWERKHAITREYQDAARRAEPDPQFSYGALEGYLTAKALVTALRGTGRELSRAAFVKWLEGASFDLGGVRVQYRPDDHAGSRFVDLSMVGRQGRFMH